MLKLVILRFDKQNTSQKIVLFFLKECFLTFIYKYLIIFYKNRLHERRKN